MYVGGAKSYQTGPELSTSCASVKQKSLLMELKRTAERTENFVKVFLRLLPWMSFGLVVICVCGCSYSVITPVTNAFKPLGLTREGLWKLKPHCDTHTHTLLLFPLCWIPLIGIEEALLSKLPDSDLNVGGVKPKHTDAQKIKDLFCKTIEHV